jgi:hypothetical protein
VSRRSAQATSEIKQKFLVAFWSEQRRFDDAATVVAESSPRLSSISSITRACSAADRTTPPFAHFALADLELRLDQGNDFMGFGQERFDARENQFQGNE